MFTVISRATGEIDLVKRPQYRHYMRRIYEGALERTDFVYKPPSGKSLFVLITIIYTYTYIVPDTEQICLLKG